MLKILAIILVAYGSLLSAWLLIFLNLILITASPGRASVCGIVPPWGKNQPKRTGYSRQLDEHGSSRMLEIVKAVHAVIHIVEKVLEQLERAA